MTRTAATCRIVLNAALLCLVGVQARAQQGTPPPEPEATRDESWTRSTERGGRKWNITSYLQGTTEEVAQSLNAQVMEADAKLAEALADLELNELEAAAETDAVLTVVRAKPEYAKTARDAEAAKGAVTAAREASQSTADRMAASRRYNEIRAGMEAMERRALAASDTLARRKKDRPELLAKVDRLYEQRKSAMEWRTRLVNAILTGLTMRGPAVAGETTGLLRGATVERVLNGRDVIVKFPLFEYDTVLGDEEGITKVQGRGREIDLLVKGLDNVNRLRPGEPLDVPRIYRMVDRGLDAEAERYVHVVEPHRCDEEDLVLAIIKRPPFKAPDRPTPTTKPAGEGKAKKAAKK